MESSDLNQNHSAPSGDDPIDTLLRRHGPAPLPDDGFSARVVAALPSARRTRSLRLVFVAVAGLAGLALTMAGIVAAGGTAALYSTVVGQFRMLSPELASASGACGSALSIAAVATAASLLYAFRPRFARRRVFAI